MIVTMLQSCEYVKYLTNKLPPCLFSLSFFFFFIYNIFFLYIYLYILDIVPNNGATVKPLYFIDFLLLFVCSFINNSRDRLLFKRVGRTKPSQSELEWFFQYERDGGIIIESRTAATHDPLTRLIEKIL